MLVNDMQIDREYSCRAVDRYPTDGPGRGKAGVAWRVDRGTRDGFVGLQTMDAPALFHVPFQGRWEHAREAKWT